MELTPKKVDGDRILCYNTNIAGRGIVLINVIKFSNF